MAFVVIIQNLFFFVVKFGPFIQFEISFAAEMVKLGENKKPQCKANVSE